ncbi:LAFE_0D09846g1_1 [Lachancea fermentati]|uniref:LAFE_0D09846g1_1 n=1 Tax=Lachancea fermentati TaxID=4955 RepID=A0A1G4MC39_LACFM|nr:LAFE_0D09846g1_1 [Lachancea fermentati]
MKSNVFVGLKPSSGFQDCKDKSLNSYDYVLLPITNSRYRDHVKRVFQEYREQTPGVRKLWVPEPQLQELAVPPFTNDKDTPGYIGLISSWLELESGDACVRELSFQVLVNEWEYARFVGIKQLILAPPRDLNNLHQYAQMIAKALSRGDEHSPVLSISLPLFEDTDPLSTWELWSTIRKICDYHQNLTISLALPRDKTPSYVLERWLAEPVTCLLVSSSIFATNQYNFPVLNKFNQYIIHEFQKVNGNSQPKLGELCIILHGVEKYANEVRGGESAYLEYINYLLKRGDKAMGMEYANVADCIPRIMPPLSPFEDNLANEAYHTFEKDQTKYNLYEQAITQALEELIREQKTMLVKNNRPIVVLVAGAGRGPLVDRALQALKALNVPQYHIIALEKNPEAFLYLQKRKYEYWNDAVDIVRENMCSWNKPIKVDICISELLGSFGCNELSPECLWSIQKNHSKPSTKFIPQSYSSYLAPVSAPLLHQKLHQMKELNSQEKLWVIHNIPYCILSTKINEIWAFNHPSTPFSEPFTKSVVAEFKIRNKGEIHGLVGYFTAKLYGTVTLSILPNDHTVKLFAQQDDDIAQLSIDDARPSSELYIKSEHTPNMTSWSPIFFPLKQPFFISDDTQLEVFVTRNHSQADSKVWYEWSVGSFVYLVVPDRHSQQEKLQIKSQTRNASKIASSSSRFASPPAIGIEKAFGQFQPSPITLKATDESRVENEILDTTEMESDFVTQQQTGWESVQDIHGLGITNTPVFDLNVDNKTRESDENSTIEEFHVRVKTGLSELHNVGGKYSCLSLDYDPN